MPTYEYRCDACDHQFEQFRGFSEPHPDECPRCFEPYGDDYQFHQAYANNRPLALVRGNPTTFGQQAEINAKRAGKEQLAIMTEIAKPENRKKKTLKVPDGASIVDTKPAPTPWFRDGSVPGVPKLDKPLNLNKIPNVDKYIQTGNK